MIKFLPERLREMRLKMKMTQRDVANALHLSPSLISSYESGDRTPSADVLLSISYLYKCSTDYLLGRDFLKESEEIVLDTKGLTDDKIKVLKDLINMIKR